MQERQLQCRESKRFVVTLTVWQVTRKITAHPDAKSVGRLSSNSLGVYVAHPHPVTHSTTDAFVITPTDARKLPLFNPCYHSNELPCPRPNTNSCANRFAC